MSIEVTATLLIKMFVPGSLVPENTTVLFVVGVATGLTVGMAILLTGMLIVAWLVFPLQSVAVAIKTISLPTTVDGTCTANVLLYVGAKIFDMTLLNATAPDAVTVNCFREKSSLAWTMTVNVSFDITSRPALGDAKKTVGG